MNRVICLTGSRTGDLLRLEGLRILASSYGAAQLAQDILALKETYAGLPFSHEGIVDGEQLEMMRDHVVQHIVALRAAAEAHRRHGGRRGNAGELFGVTAKD
jgi:hypothetical protein